MSVSSTHCPLQSYQVSEKSNARFLRFCGDGRTDGHSQVGAQLKLRTEVENCNVLRTALNFRLAASYLTAVSMKWQESIYFIRNLIYGSFLHDLC